MSERHYDIVEMQLGWMGLLSSEAGLLRSTLPEESEDECVSRLGLESGEATRAPSRFADLRDRLVRYFDGSDTGFGDVALDLDDAPRLLSQGMAGLPHNPAWRDSHIQVACGQGGESECAESRRSDDGSQPDSDNSALPQGNWVRRQSSRVRQRRYSN